jgi:hypothetical protein
MGKSKDLAQDEICEFIRACYGFLDASRNWSRTLKKVLYKYGLRPLKTDPSIFALITDAEGQVAMPNSKLVLEPPGDEVEFENSVFEIEKLPDGHHVAGLL